MKEPSLLSFETIQQAVQELSPRYPQVLKVFLFGSYAKKESNEQSDVDLHLISDGTMSLTELITYENALTNRLKKKADVLGSAFNATPTEFLNIIKPDEILLYRR
ncbi:MAG: Nucleotidyltransferase domain protein [Tenericutes bacterium ADurb.BinA155]|nr:MAG: Nucleotidyltransferase domain protein [Tenericutes bacterium ADurb.BinA155]